MFFSTNILSVKNLQQSDAHVKILQVVMQFLIRAFLLTLNLRTLLGFGIDHHEYNNVECTNRFEYRHLFKRRFKNCQDTIKHHNALCGMNLTIAYSLHPPYVFHDHNGEVRGILPGNCI